MIPTGILLGLLAAVAVSFHNRQARQLGDVDTALVNWGKFLAAAAVAALLITFTNLGAWTWPTQEFLIMVLIAIPVERSIAHFSTKAYQLSPQSLMSPLSGLTPILLLPIGFVFLHEVPTLWGVAGVSLIVIGTISLGWQSGHTGLSALKNIWSEPGTKYMLGAALAAAAAAVIAKFAFQHNAAVLFVFYVFSVNVLISTPNMLHVVTSALGRKKLRAHLTPLSRAAIAYGALSSIHFIGLSYLPAAHFAAIKRTSILLDVIAGSTLGKETAFRKRFGAGLLVLVGFALFLLH